MWPGSGFSGFTLFGLFKNKLLLERDREKRTVQDLAFFFLLFRRIISKRHFFFIKTSHDGKNFFFFFFGIVVYEVRERESVKERRH